MSEPWNQDCDSNEEVDAHSVAMPAGLVIPRNVEDVPTDEQVAREQLREAYPGDTWNSLDNPAIWDGDSDDDGGQPPSAHFEVID